MLKWEVQLGVSAAGDETGGSGAGEALEAVGGGMTCCWSRG